MNADKTTKQGRLIAALLTTQTLKEAAKEANIPYETARRMMRDPDMQAALSETQQEAAKEAILEAANLARLTRETLRQVMEDADAPPHARVRASEVSLNYEWAIGELFEIHARLEAIEARLAAKDAA